MRRMLVSMIGLLAMLPASTAWAQGPRLDNQRFIEGLENQGMSELLLHLAQSPDIDPIDAKKIQISQYKLLSRRPIDAVDAQEAARQAQERVAAIDQAIQAQRELIEQNASNPLRSVWLTELAEALLFDKINLVAPRALEFYEFGVPTRDQNQAVQALIPQAYEAMAQADAALFRLPNELQQNLELRQRLENSGQLDRIQNAYGRERLPFFKAMAAYYTALLPDSNVYFQTLGQNAAVPAVTQKKTPKEERARLLALVVTDLDPFVRDEMRKDVTRQSLSFTGRAQLAMERLDDAQTNLEKVVRERKDEPNEVLSLMALARINNQRDRTNDLQAVLDRLRSHGRVVGDIGYRLLLTDLMHNLRMSKVAALPADQRAAAVAAAYKPYEELLEDRTLDDQTREGLRQTLYSRWAETLGATGSPADLPTMVVMALAESALAQGRNFAAEAYPLPEEDAQKQTLMDKAAPQLARATELFDLVLTRPDAAPPMRAQAMFDKGLARFFTGPEDLVVVLATTDIWVELADKMPDQPLAETAMGEAMRLLRQLDEMAPRPVGVHEKYEAAYKVLVARLPTSHVADNQYAYYGMTFLETRGQYQEAIDTYKKVPIGHPNYFDAQRNIVYCMMKLYEVAPRKDKIELAEQIVTQARSLREQTRTLLDNNVFENEIQAAALRSAEGYARLVLGQISLERGNYEAALEPLADFENDFQADPDLARQGPELRIVVLVAANKLKEASALATQLMQNYPASAAAVINNVLTRLDQQIDQLRQELATETLDRRKADLNDQITKCSQAAEIFARLLVDFGKRQNYTAAQMVPLQAVFTKSLRLSGKPAEALKVIEPLYKQAPNEIEVIHNLAEAYYALDQYEQALPLYAKLINGVKPTDAGVYPPNYWNAWMRTMQIRDKSGKDTGRIVDAVKGLRLTNPGLGGEPFRGEMERLERKHSISAPASSNR
ncbi:MAG: tetratricopeptide repeat protein [Phycisphaeraceae bacterium]